VAAAVLSGRRGRRDRCSEIYLTHMFVVIAMLRIFSSTGASMGSGVLWYAPTIAACWVLGWVVAHYFSGPCDRGIRRRLIETQPRTPSRAERMTI